MKSESDCFADEIAIDFPSVGHLVARVRASFLAEAYDDHAGPLKTEVCLSSDEAFRGLIVPLEVPVRRICHRCGGRGETWAERCAACSGTGNLVVRHRLRITVPPRVADGYCFHFRVRSPHEPPIRIEARVVVRA